MRKRRVRKGGGPGRSCGQESRRRKRLTCTVRTTHLPYTSWRPSYVTGRARGRAHRRGTGQEVKRVPEIVFDSTLLVAEGERETLAVLVIRDRRTGMLFAHVAPRKGFAHEHGSMEMLKELSKLWYHEVILKYDGEPALRGVQEEAQRRREAPTLVENSRIAGAVSPIGPRKEQVRVLRHGLEARFGIKVWGTQPLIAWLAEHAVDILSKCEVSADGRTSYATMKGKPCIHEAV